MNWQSLDTLVVIIDGQCNHYHVTLHFVISEALSSFYPYYCHVIYNEDTVSKAFNIIGYRHAMNQYENLLSVVCKTVVM